MVSDNPKYWPESFDLTIEQVNDQVFKARAAFENAKIPRQELVDSIRTLLLMLPHASNKGPVGPFWRARVNPPGVLFESVSELWYPPPIKVNRTGRFNRVQTSWFYCASSLATAVFELRPRVGDLVTLIAVGAKEERARLNLAPVGFGRAADKLNGVIGGVRLQENPLICEVAKSSESLHAWNQADDFLGSVLTATDELVLDHIYDATKAVADFLFLAGKDEPVIDAIVYPSVGHRLYGFNVRLRPEAADRHAGIKAAILIKIISVTEEKIGFELMGGSGGADRRGIIRWCPRPKFAQEINSFLENLSSDAWVRDLVRSLIVVV